MRFTVLVEIKRPDTRLLARPYRDAAHVIGPELAGGVSQVQANCRRWAVEGARMEANRELVDERIYTEQPKGVLVIGRTATLADAVQARTFELFRRNLYNPEIITFDELLARARFLLVAGDAADGDAAERAVEAEPEEADDFDDLPF